MNKLLVVASILFLGLCARIAFADTVTRLNCSQASCPQQSGTNYSATNVYPLSIDGNGTVTGYVDVVSIAGFGRNGHRADTWYTVTWDNTGMLVNAVFDQNGGVGYSYSPGPGGFYVTPADLEARSCCSVTNGYQSSYSKLNGNWLAYLDTP